MSLLSFDVIGMTCGSCAATVERALAKLDGINQSGVTFSLALASVVADLNRVALAQIEVMITLLGYPAKARRQGMT